MRRLMKQLDHVWRLSGTTLSFGVFGLAGLIFGSLLFPLMFLFMQDARARQFAARRLIGKSFGAFIWMMKSLGVLSYQILGSENIVPGKNQLIIANHPTLIDVVFLVSMFPQTDCVIKEAVTKNPFMRSTVAAANYISNSEPDELLEACVARLNSGRSLLLFPEGTRTINQQSLHFKLGAATVAVRTNVEILPIVIDCTPGFLGKLDRWHKVPPSRPHFTIRILAATRPARLVPAEQDLRQARHSLNNALLTLITGETT
jgi:1-acyl-sn-glycerol-3-phosphate acyltransferase